MLSILSEKARYVEEFRASYKVWIKRHGEYLDVKSDELLMYFIRYHAYNVDLFMWTVRKTEKNSEGYDEKAKESVFRELVQDIRHWLESDDTDYEKWHKETCQKYVDNFNLLVGKGNYEPIAFGRGQKIVNMTMKYLSSCHNSEIYEERFKPCHMPLDSRILDRFYYVEIKSGTPKNEYKKWTLLTYEEYADIANDIKEYFAKQGKYPIAEEWEIWNKVSAE